MKINILKYLRYIFISFVSGLTGVIPGMSGGTIFAIFNVSQDLVEAITKVLTLKKENIKKYIALPIILGGGSLFSSIIYSNIFLLYINDYLIFFEYLFIGLIIFSMPILLNETKAEKSIYKRVFLFSSGLVVALIIFAVSSNDISNTTNNIYAPLYLIKYAIISFINGMTMIIPGISGTNILILFGEYSNYLEFNAHFLSYPVQNSIFLIFVIIGNISSSFLLSYIFKKYYAQFFLVMSGLTLSTIFILYNNPFLSINTFIQAIVGFVLGALLIKVTIKREKKQV